MKSKLLLALALACALPATAGSAAPAPAAPASPPTLADPAAAWARFYATSEADDTMATYQVLSKMYGSKGVIDEECRQFLPELDAAIAKVPVAIGLWRGGELCAQQLHDETLVKLYSDGVGKLAAYALARSGVGRDSKPIAVITGDDVKAIIDATGLDVLYGYGEWRLKSPYLRLNYALWDKDQGVERHLGFDYMDTYFRTAHKEAGAGFPSYRRVVRDSMIGSMAKAHDDATRDLGLADSSRKSEVLEDQLAVLRPAAADGGLVSAYFWWSVCKGKDAACADGLVDALLPGAEKGYAMYRVQLALSYADGVGVKQDVGAALTLLDAAEKRWPGNAYAAFTEFMVGHGRPVPDEVLARLDRGAKQGQRRTMQAWARAQSARLGGKPELPPELLARMRELGEKDVPAALSALSEHDRKSDPAAAREWLRRGAATGDSDLLLRHGIAQVYANPGPRDLAAGVETIREAAMAGDDFAMAWMGMLESQRKHWSDANLWYGSAIAYENLDALVPLLRLYSEPHAGVSPAPAQVLAKYEKMDKAGFDDVRFRRAYADYLLRKAQPRDPVKARALLQVDADKDDAMSQVLLGINLLEGKYGQKDAKEGLHWIEKAIARDHDAADSFANYLYYRDRSAAARLKAIAMERTLVAGDENGARNNLAWWLCTAEDANLRAPAEGLKVALAMGPTDKVEAAALDTVAACHAANGDFAKAQEVQSIAVERAKILPISEDDSEMDRRLELYRQHKAYVEKREDEASPES